MPRSALNLVLVLALSVGLVLLPGPAGGNRQLQSGCGGRRRLTADGCGGVAHTCCCQPVQGPPRYFGCCRDPSLWCHFFDFTPPGIPGACPQPSLCLPVPQGCGAAGQPCCPPASDLGAGFTCKAPLVCQGSPEGDGWWTSYDLFLDLQNGNMTAITADTYGTCVEASPAAAPGAVTAAGSSRP